MYQSHSCCCPQSVAQDKVRNMQRKGELDDIVEAHPPRESAEEEAAAAEEEEEADA